MHIALLVLPGVEATSFWTLVAATWIAAAIGTFLTWLVDRRDRRRLHGRAAAVRRRRAPGPRPGGRRRGVRAAGRGALPGRAVGAAVRHDADPAPLGGRPAATGSRSGRCSCRAPRRPASRASCTAPATACRRSGGTTASSVGCWWPTARRTPPIIEERASTGRGLLADDGVSISNLFSGDARDQHDDDEQGQPRPRVAGDPAGRRAVRAAAGRLRAQHRPDGRPRWSASGSRRASSAAATSYPGCTGRGPSRSCGR